MSQIETSDPGIGRDSDARGGLQCLSAVSQIETPSPKKKSGGTKKGVSSAFRRCLRSRRRVRYLQSRRGKVESPVPFGGVSDRDQRGNAFFWALSRRVSSAFRRCLRSRQTTQSFESLCNAGMSPVPFGGVSDRDGRHLGRRRLRGRRSPVPFGGVSDRDPGSPPGGFFVSICGLQCLSAVSQIETVGYCGSICRSFPCLQCLSAVSQIETLESEGKGTR